MNKKTSIWINLYNTLYIVSSEFKKLEYLESPIFEVLDELESSIVGGLRNESLAQYLKEKWINYEQKKELENFRIYLDKIDAKYWNSYDFDNNEDWILARSWAKSLILKLGIKKDGWNTTGEIIIHE